MKPRRASETIKGGNNQNEASTQGPKKTDWRISHQLGYLHVPTVPTV